jgi:glucosamine 6-phosphate synthetase-like amidotransferase/phosphosugar isomerase protein
MCGINGILISPGRTPSQLRRIRELFTANLLANEQRGREATGIALLNKDSSMRVNKAPVTASRFIHSPGYLGVLDSLSEKTTVLLGHTREPTKGTPQKNTNNHPIIRGNIIGVHNGTITNDDLIFAQQKISGDRIGSVDSEAIIALLDSISGFMNLPSYKKHLYKVSQVVIGSYAILYVNPALPYSIFLLKYKNPVSVHWDSELGALIFSSRYLFLRKAFGRSAITEGLPGRTGFMFDARMLSKHKEHPIQLFSLFSNAEK